MNWRVDYFDIMGNRRSVVVAARDAAKARAVILREQLTNVRSKIYAVYQTESSPQFKG